MKTIKQMSEEEQREAKLRDVTREFEQTHAKLVRDHWLAQERMARERWGMVKVVLWVASMPVIAWVAYKLMVSLFMPVSGV